MPPLPTRTISSPLWTFTENTTIQLLLCCIAPSTDSQTVQKIRTFTKSEIDWQVLVNMARQHHVLSLLYHGLNNSCPDAVPEPLLKELRRYYQSIAVRNLFMTAELNRILLLMGSKGIDTLPYKGPILANTLYGRLELRQFGDLDIIIQPQDMLSVEKLLIAEGYRPYFGKKTAVELAAYMKAKTEHTYDFYHDDKEILVEIHWRFWPPFFSSVTPREIWNRRESTKIGGSSVSTLKIEDYLVILCMHGSRHMWERLSWLCDIAVLIGKYPDLDWQWVVKTAEKWGVKRMLCLGLYLAHCWLEASLPELISNQISADSTIVELANQVDAQIFGLAETHSQFMASTRYQVKVRERWSDKAIYAESFIYWLLKGRPSSKLPT